MRTVPKHRRRPNRQNYVYFIQAGDDGPVKIGLTADVDKRLAVLQTGNHHELHLRYTLRGDESMEAKFHRRLRDALIRGEWFQCGPALALAREVCGGETDGQKAHMFKLAREAQVAWEAMQSR